MRSYLKPYPGSIVLVAFTAVSWFVFFLACFDSLEAFLGGWPICWWHSGIAQNYQSISLL